MQKPSLSSFGLTEVQYQYWRDWEEETLWRLATRAGLLAVIGCAVVGYRDGGIAVAIVYTIGMGVGIGLFGSVIIGVAIPAIVRRVNRVAGRYVAYKTALEAYEKWNRRAQEAYWLSLSGPAFETALGHLFERNGYQVTQTPPSGDGGIDLLVEKDGRSIVVQCKATRNPVGPEIARELYGALIASGADLAVLAATGGVTIGVRQFAADKPIAIVTLADILSFHRGQDPIAVYDLNRRLVASR